MTLEQATERLEQLITELTEEGSKLGEMEYHYEQRKAEIMMQDLTQGYSRAETRSASVALALEAEGLTWPLIRQKGIYKRLATEKDILLELSRNLREMRRNETSHN